MFCFCPTSGFFFSFRPSYCHLFYLTFSFNSCLSHTPIIWHPVPAEHMQLLAADSYLKAKLEVPYKRQAGDWGALGAVSSPRLVTITEVSDFPCGGAQPGSEDSENQQVEDSKHLGNTACLWFSITALNPPQCLLVRHSPQGYLIERDADAWLGAKASRSLLWALCSSCSQKSLTLPIMSLWGGHRAKRMASQLPLLQVHTQGCSVFMCQCAL